MKKLIAVTAILITLLLSGCKGGNGDSSLAPTQGTTQAEESITEQSKDVNTSDKDEVIEDKQLQPIDNEAEHQDEWRIITHTNHVPFTPKNYQGRTVNYTTTHLLPDGQMQQTTFSNVAFVTPEDAHRYADYEEYLSYNVWLKVDGKEEVGKFFWTSEDLLVLQHIHDETVENFVLDVYLPADIYNEVTYDIWQYGAHIVAQTDRKVLMVAGSYVFTYNFETFTTNLVSSSALDTMYDRNNEKFYFTDWWHVEYEVDWQNDDAITETGNEVIHYRNESFELTIREDCEGEFHELQAAWNNGEDMDALYGDEYNIDFEGTIYRLSDNTTIGNLHLPHSYEYNSNLMYHLDHFYYFLIEDAKLHLYYYGIELRSWELTDENWRIIEACVDLNNYYRECDTNHDERVDADEFVAAISDVHVILMNDNESSVYIVTFDEGPKKVLSDVVDYGTTYYYDLYRTYHSDFYWMDSKTNAYCFDWLDTQTNTLMGTGAIAIAPSRIIDKAAGFLVDPTGSQDYMTVYGYPLALNWKAYHATE